MPSFSVQRIDHLVLRVEDLERSIEFYRTVLGCQVEKRRDDLGLVHLRAGASMIDLVSVDGPLGRKGGAPAESERRNLDHFCLRIDPFDEDALIAHLAQAGLYDGGGVKMRFGAEGDGPSVYIADPDGNTIELKGAAGSKGPDKR